MQLYVRFHGATVVTLAARCPPTKRCAATVRGWELTRVVVASTNIPPGTILREDLVTIAKIPRKFRAAAMVNPKELKTLWARR